MVFNITKEDRAVFQYVSQAAEDLSYPTYVVGGYVRDRLLGRLSKDMDIVCVGDGIELAHAVAALLRPRPQVTVYKRFGTAMLRMKDMEIEFVGARKESYSRDSRKPSVSKGSLEDDQNRRDFTINALAVSLNETDFGKILDPFHGIYDLESKTIKTPLEPGRTFSDDPLRMMRAVRFATQLGFEIEDGTMKALSQFKNRLNIISQERITSELNKIVLSQKPSIGFKILYDTGLLEIIFPELVRMQGVEVRNGISHKDNFYHTLEVLDNLCKKTDNLWLRWSAILHDIGKPPTKRFEKGNGWTFHGHEAVGANMVPKIFKKMKQPLDHQMKYVQKLVRLHQRPICLSKDEITDAAMRRLLFDADEDLEDLMMLCESDITSKNPKKVQRYLDNYKLVRQRLKEVEENDHIRNWQPPISGDEIMSTFGISPSREVGVIKNAIKEGILDGDIKNTYEDAHSFMLAKGTELGLKPV